MQVRFNHTPDPKKCHINLKTAVEHGCTPRALPSGAVQDIDLDGVRKFIS